MHADEVLTAFVELERQVLTVTFWPRSLKIAGVLVRSNHVAVPRHKLERRIAFTGRGWKAVMP